MSSHEIHAALSEKGLTGDLTIPQQALPHVTLVVQQTSFQA